MALHSYPAQVADMGLPVLEKVLAPFDSFCHRWTAETTRSIEITEFTALYATQDPPTSYLGGEDTSAAKSVTVGEISQQIRLNAAEALKGHEIDPQRVSRHAHALANKLWDKVAAQITAATFTNTPINTGTEASFDTADIESLYAGIPGGSGRYLLLSPASFAAVMLPASNDTFVAGRALYGFDGVYEVDKWDASGLQANTHGIACTPESFAVASGIPRYGDDVEILDEEIHEVPGIGMSVAFRKSVDPGTRAQAVTMDVLFGAAPGVEEALTIIRTAA